MSGGTFKACATCGTAFRTYGKDAAFCSDACTPKAKVCRCDDPWRDEEGMCERCGRLVNRHGIRFSSDTPRRGR